MAKSMGRVRGVNGNMVTVEFDSAIAKNEVGYIQVGDERLKGEVIRIKGNEAALQVFELGPYPDRTAQTPPLQGNDGHEFLFPQCQMVYPVNMPVLLK